MSAFGLTFVVVSEDGAAAISVAVVERIAVATRELRVVRTEDLPSDDVSPIRLCIEHWLSHDVPYVCDGCEEIAYDVTSRLDKARTKELLLCVECR